MMCSILGELNQLPEWQMLHFIYFSKEFQFTCTKAVTTHLSCTRKILDQNGIKIQKHFKIFLYFSKCFCIIQTTSEKIKGPMAKTDNISFICFISLSKKAQ